MARAPPFVLALLLLVSFAPGASAVTIDQPRWAVGDEWTYAIELVENGQTVQTGDRHVVVTKRGTFHERDALWFTTYQNMSGDPAFSYADIRDATTGALLGTESGGEALAAAEPCHEIQYPLAYPKSWTVVCDLGAGPAETMYSVAGAQTIAVPAGTYETLSVDAIGNDVVRYWFAGAACGKVAEFSQTNDLQTYVNLTAVRCTPVAGAGATPPTATPAGATPTGTTAAATPTGSGATPTSPLTAGAPTGTPTRAATTTDTPMPAVAALLASLGVAALALRRKPS